MAAKEIGESARIRSVAMATPKRSSTERRIFSYFWRLATAATVSALRVTTRPPETLVRWSLSTRAGHSTTGEAIGIWVVRPATGSASVGVRMSVGREARPGRRKFP